MASCAGSQELSAEVSNFMQLLIQTDKPTLAEYARFSGECGGESELAFTLKECQARGWSVASNECVDFSQQRCHMADQQPSMVLTWLRDRFSTVGANYQILGIQSMNGRFKHESIEVKIGKSQFLLFHNTEPNSPTGLVVGVSQVNGKKIEDYLKSPE